MNKRNKICFLFGAGASAFSELNQPYPRPPHPLPPLGNQLFKKMKERGYIPDNLPKDLHARFEENFEEGMDRLTALSSDEYARFQIRLAVYLAQFSPSPENYYVQLCKIIISKKIDCVFSTLNYDLMIEEALELATCYDSSVLKPHGSINFLPRYSGSMQDVCLQGFSGDDVSCRVKIVSREKVIEFCQENESKNNPLTPVMSYYQPDKKSKICSAFIQQERTRWENALKESQILYIVGVAFNKNDTHIWQTITKSGCEVRIVDPKPQSIINYFKERDVNVAHYAKSFKNAIRKWKKDFNFKTKKKFTPW